MATRLTKIGAKRILMGGVFVLIDFSVEAGCNQGMIDADEKGRPGQRRGLYIGLGLLVCVRVRPPELTETRFGPDSAVGR